MAVTGWIIVDDLYCKGCGLCIEACPQEVLEFDLDRLTPKGYHPARMTQETCTGCGICTHACLVERSQGGKAINIEPVYSIVHLPEAPA